MFAVLALFSAVCYGAADFLGGIMARRASTLAIVLWSQLAGLALLLVFVPVLPASPVRADYLWGAVAGVMGGTGVALLYRALAIGVMAVVAPTTAVCAVALPVLVAVAMGERLAPAAIAGILLAIVAIVLVSQSTHAAPDASQAPDAGARIRAIPLAILSGIAIGLFFVALARTSRDAGLYPLVAARSASVALFAAAAVISGKSLALGGRVAAVVAAGGTLDMLANLLYLVATRSGPLSVVVTLASLYPASTVLLARLFLHERLNARQWVGIACALIAVALIVA